MDVYIASPSGGPPLWAPAKVSGFNGDIISFSVLVPSPGDTPTPPFSLETLFLHKLDLGHRVHFPQGVKSKTLPRELSHLWPATTAPSTTTTTSSSSATSLLRRRPHPRPTTTTTTTPTPVLSSHAPSHSLPSPFSLPKPILEMASPLALRFGAPPTSLVDASTPVHFSQPPPVHRSQHRPNRSLADLTTRVAPVTHIDHTHLAEEIVSAQRVGPQFYSSLAVGTEVDALNKEKVWAPAFVVSLQSGAELPLEHIGRGGGPRAPPLESVGVIFVEDGATATLPVWHIHPLHTRSPCILPPVAPPTSFQPSAPSSLLQVGELESPPQEEVMTQA